ncbi:MAG: phosphatase PAP2 family protein [Candidatus Micrarchaeia archaeon]
MENVGVMDNLYDIPYNVVYILSAVIDKFLYIFLGIIFLIFLYYYLKGRKKENEKKLFCLILSIILVSILVPSLKNFFKKERPCIGNIECPSDFSFPSGHVAISSVFLFIFDFPFSLIYFFFFLFVAFSRIFLGFHTFSDIVFGSVIGISVYLILFELLYKKEIKEMESDREREREKGRGVGEMEMNEITRQIAHLLFGILSIGIILIFQDLSIYIFFFLLLFFIFSSILKIPFINEFIETLGYRDIIRCSNVIFYICGILLLLIFLKTDYIISSIYILAVGDSVSPFFIEIGKERKKRKSEKFFKGNIFSVFAFIIFSLPVPIFLIGEKGILLVFLCAILESINLRINDNLLIPLTCLIFLSSI